MAGFTYRLQQVFNLRERKKKEQEQKVIFAQQRVRDIELQIEEKKTEIRQVRHNMMISDHMLMPVHDRYIHKLNQEIDQLYLDLETAKQQLAYEKQLLVKAQADLEALIKHKEKVYLEYLEEQKRKEMKILDEIAGQRFFRNQLLEEAELAEEALKHEEESADDENRNQQSPIGLD